MAILRGLDDGEVVVTLEAAALGAFTLPRAVIVFITRIKVGLLMRLLILYPLIL